MAQSKVVPTSVMMPMIYVVSPDADGKVSYPVVVKSEPEEGFSSMGLVVILVLVGLFFWGMAQDLRHAPSEHSRPSVMSVRNAN
jgi:hypothetical protein